VPKEEAISALRAPDRDADKVRIALPAIEGVYLRGRTLRFANFNESQLYGADLTGADLTRADLTGADMKGADLSHANLTDAKNVSPGQWGQACGDEKTIPPPGLTPPKPCPPKR
jgi:hypothetical protein